MSGLLITAPLLRACWPAVTGAEDWAPILTGAALRWRITTRRHVAAWLAQCGHESGDGNVLAENLYYTTARRVLDVFGRYACISPAALAALALRRPGEPWPAAALTDAAALLRNPEALGNRVYGGRYGNGPEASGDGWRCRGGGLTQLTFRSGWAAYGEAVGLTVEAAADRARTRQGAADSAGWYFLARGLGPPAEAGDFDRVACLTAGKQDAEKVEGITDRRERWHRCCVAVGLA